MARRSDAVPDRYALMLVEGDTEEIFYAEAKRRYFRSARSKIINLRGNWSIEKKILDEVASHAEAHPGTVFSAPICIDRESRAGQAPIRLDLVKSELSSYRNVDLDGIRVFEAVQDIECWFFHDIEGIFQFLRLPRSQRSPAKFRPVEKLCHLRLSELFERAGRDYRKGRASRAFLESLDLDLIRSRSATLDALCDFMRGFASAPTG